MRVDFEVRGLPVPQGNAKVFASKGQKPHVVSKSAALVDWRQAIATAARDAMQTRGYAPFQSALGVIALFVFPKPKSAPKNRAHPTGPPDIDKLARAVLDGMTGIVYIDDSRVVVLSTAKAYGLVPGVSISVYEEGAP